MKVQHYEKEEEERVFRRGQVWVFDSWVTF